jgi:hypothetical protein
MRHDLRRKLGRAFSLPSRMLPCSDAAPLILGTRDPQRVAPPERAAFGAGDLAVVTPGADADFAIAARAAEETSLSIDHRPPYR